MNDFQLGIYGTFAFMTVIFEAIKSHWLLSIFLLVAIFSLIIDLFLIIRGSK